MMSLALLFLPAFTAASPSTITFESGDQQAHLVELFTSQGCSSCPPAERWLNKWQHHPLLWKQIVPVAFHVDYWDRLGWPDPFASEEYSLRQRRYQRLGNIHSVYTPGFVVNGAEWRGYFSGNKLPDTLSALGHIKANLQEDIVNIEFSSDKASWFLPIHIHFAILGVDIVTEIKAGENAKRTLTQDFVALHYQRHTSESGKWQTQIPNYKREDIQRYAIAVWTSHPVSGQVIQATGTWLP